MNKELYYQSVGFQPSSKNPSLLPMEDMSILHNESPSPVYSSDFEIKCRLSKSNAVSGSCDHNGGVLTSKNGDINIRVPVGAIKDRDFVKFYIATDLYGPYALPSQN